MTELEINMVDAYLELTKEIFTDNELNTIAVQYNLDSNYLLEKINEVLVLAGNKGLKLYESPIIEGFDVQGLPNARLIDNDSEWTYIRNAILHAKKNPNVLRTIISGWDYESVRHLTDEILGGVIECIIPEGGSIFEYKETVHNLYSLKNSNNLYETEKKVFKEAAKQGLMLAIQGNISKSINCIYFEANGPTRGNLRKHFLVIDKDPSTKNLYYAIKHSDFDTSGFTYEDEKIKFEPTTKNTEILHFILSEVYTLQSVRFAEEEGDKISIRRDNEDNTDFALKDINGFTEATISDEWDVEIKKDFCADIIKTNNGIRPTKEYAADYFGKIAFGGTDFILAHFGDEISDVFELKNALPFILENSDAGKYCIDKGIGHVTVKNVIEYFLIMTAITDKAIKNKIQTRPTPMVNIETTFL